MTKLYIYMFWAFVIVLIINNKFARLNVKLRGLIYEIIAFEFIVIFHF